MTRYSKQEYTFIYDEWSASGIYLDGHKQLHRCQYLGTH